MRNYFQKNSCAIRVCQCEKMPRTRNFIHHALWCWWSHTKNLLHPSSQLCHYHRWHRYGAFNSMPFEFMATQLQRLSTHPNSSSLPLPLLVVFKDIVPTHACPCPCPRPLALWNGEMGTCKIILIYDKMMQTCMIACTLLDGEIEKCVRSIR